MCNVYRVSCVCVCVWELWQSTFCIHIRRSSSSANMCAFEMQKKRVSAATARRHWVVKERMSVSVLQIYIQLEIEGYFYNYIDIHNTHAQLENMFIFQAYRFTKTKLWNEIMQTSIARMRITKIERAATEIVVCACFGWFPNHTRSWRKSNSKIDGRKKWNRFHFEIWPLTWSISWSIRSSFKMALGSNRSRIYGTNALNGIKIIENDKNWMRDQNPYRMQWNFT